ncbi:MAG: hypothetical protein GX348_11255 [Veillonellaceae bacterium]|jgi:hypothetical protein|nr:hypothetical protein [Veillonellaceae bacterium]
MSTIIKKKLQEFNVSDADIEAILAIYDHKRVLANIKHAERAIIDRQKDIEDVSSFVNIAIIQNWALA